MGARFNNLVEMFERTCEEHAGRPALGVKNDGAWTWTTYAELQRLTTEFRAGLASIGVGPGDRVAIVANNRIEWAVAAYATYGLEAIFVPLYQAQSAAEWELVLGDCGAKVVLAANDAIAAELKRRQNDLPLLTQIVVLESESDDSFRALLRAGQRSPVPPRQVTPGACATMIYTSGTTGRPKGVMLTHGNIASNIQAVHELFEFSERDRSLAFIPWAHAFGHTCELHTLLSLGASIGINDELAKLAANLIEVKPTILVAVPRVFNRIFASVEARIAARPAIVRRLYAAARTAAREPATQRTIAGRLVLWLADVLIFSQIRARFGGRLKYAISGGASLAIEVAQLLEAIGLKVYEGYGLTETSPMVAANHPGQTRIGSVGPVLPGVQVRIEQVPGLERDEGGEIVVSGPNVMAGYYQRPDEQKNAFTADGWFRTGDLGYVDREGFLYVTGRIKEQYKLENGKYVAPAVLEEQLKLSPYVANAMIYGADKPYNVAVIVIDVPAVQKWAAEQGIELDDPASDARVRDLLRGEVALHGGAFRPFERLNDFVIATRDFTVENDMLTPSLKIKRRSVMAEYGPALDALYASDSRRERSPSAESDASLSRASAGEAIRANPRP